MDKEFVEAVKTIASAIKQASDSQTKITEAISEGLEYIKTKIKESDAREKELRRDRSLRDTPIYVGDKFMFCTDVQIPVEPQKFDPDKRVIDALKFDQGSVMTVETIAVEQHRNELVYIFRITENETFETDERKIGKLLEAKLIKRIDTL